MIFADNKTLDAKLKNYEQINDVMRLRFGRVPDRWILNFAH